MAFGTKKTVAVTKATFSERLGSVKSMFKKAYEDATKLDAEMQADIENKKQRIAAIEADINTVSVTQKETQEFMSNLEKFI